MASQEPKFEREGRVWRIERQTGATQTEFEVTDTNPKQSVHIAHCSNIKVIVRGKVGEILVDNSKGINLQFESAMGSCSVINSSKSSVHVLISTPCVQINNSNGIDVYLSKESENSTEVLTSGTMEISIHAPPAEVNGDTVEFHAPQQYSHKIVKGRLITTPVQHGRF